MNPDDLAALKAAQPSFLDGRGLFPNAVPTQFAPAEPARVTRTEASAFRVGSDIGPSVGSSDGSPPPPQPPPGCPTSGTITVTFSGVDGCGCQDLGSGISSKGTVTGLNGLHTLTWDPSLSTFTASGVGSVHFTNYVDDTCSNEASSWDATMTISASCDGTTGEWNVSVSSTGNVFASAAAQLPGVPIDNYFNCSNAPWGGGTATVSL